MKYAIVGAMCLFLGGFGYHVFFSDSWYMAGWRAAIEVYRPTPVVQKELGEQCKKTVELIKKADKSKLLGDHHLKITNHVYVYYGSVLVRLKDGSLLNINDKWTYYESLAIRMAYEDRVKQWEDEEKGKLLSEANEVFKSDIK